VRAVQPGVEAALTEGQMPSRTRSEATLTRNAAVVRCSGVRELSGALAAEP